MTDKIIVRPVLVYWLVDANAHEGDWKSNKCKLMMFQFASLFEQTKKKYERLKSYVFFFSTFCITYIVDVDERAILYCNNNL